VGLLLGAAGSASRLLTATGGYLRRMPALIATAPAARRPADRASLGGVNSAGHQIGRALGIAVCGALVGTPARRSRSLPPYVTSPCSVPPAGLRPMPSLNRRD
jgi:hypothetical protein